MSWSISEMKNEVKISKACADELFEAQGGENGEIWYNRNEVLSNGFLTFNIDHMEHMDWLGTNDKLVAILKKHKVRGDICFGSLEGDNQGEFWGYRFDGAGGMKTLTGGTAFEEHVPSPFEGKKVVVTGTLEGFTRADIEARIRTAGGTVLSAVSKKVDYLIVGAKPGSKLDKARALGIEIIDNQLTLASMLPNKRA